MEDADKTTSARARVSSGTVGTLGLSGVIFAVASAGLVFLVVMPDISLPSISDKSSRASVCIVETGNGGDSDSVGMDELSDYAPLFVTTRWNQSSREKSLPLPSNWLAESSDISYGAISQKEFEVGADDLNRSKEGLLYSVMRGAFSGFGRSDSKIANADISPSFEIVDMSSGKTVSHGLAKGAPEILSKAEFFVSVGADRRISLPVVSETSGDEKSDIGLSQTVGRLLKNLGGGYYKIIFYP